MQKRRKYCLELCKRVFNSYAMGYPDSKICCLHQISQFTLYSILKENPKLKERSKVKRKINQKKIQKERHQKFDGAKYNVKKSIKKMTPQEKIDQLEKALKKEKEKNKAMSTLVKVAKDELGKY